MQKMQELSENIRNLILPPNFVSVPAAEDGYVSLRQQSGLSGEDGVQAQTNENWRHKAIRRKLSKLKELVLFVGGLPTDFEKVEYVNRISLYTNKREDVCIGPVIPTQGCLFISFASGMAAACTLKTLHNRKIFGKTPVLIFLPFINLPPGSPSYDPLLVFINSKSGGGQGKHLLDMMKGMLNKNQVFLLEQGGPIPGLYAFRKLPRFRILVCGGDGTAGWVLSALEVVHRYMTCQHPPIAVLPIGTGNDLARVLGFGSGWSGDGIGTVLYQVQEAQPVQMDRWTILFDSSPQASPVHQDPVTVHPSDPQTSSSKDDSASSKGLVNGHRRLQRSVNNNLARPINIVMSMDNGTSSERGTAETFGSTTDETGGINISNNKSVHYMNGDYSLQSTNDTAQDIFDNKKEQNEIQVKEKVLAQLIDETIDNVSSSSIDSNSTDSGLHGIPDTGNINENDEKELCSNDAEKSFPEPGQMGDYEKNNEELGENIETYRKSVHRKLQILSETDILEENASCVPYTRQISEEKEDWSRILSNSSSFPEDLLLNQQDVDEDPVTQILRSELPDIINDKQKLITLLASVNLDDPKLEQMIKDEELNQKTDDAKSCPTSPKPPAETQKSSDSNEDGINSSIPELKHRAMSEVGLRSKTGAFKKKLSLPLISEERAYGLPQNGLEEIKEEECLPRKLSPGPKVVTMNNYLGIGIGADLTLAFHLAREENPEKCTSRIRNKAVFLKAGLKKLTTRSLMLNSVVDLEVDGVKIELPSIKGLIFLNISSWGAGGNAWGSGASRRFHTPSMGDGLLEVVGVGGVAHMSQIYSGIRSGLRIAQGEYVRLNLKSEMAVQVDGEPWMQPPGPIIITVSALQMTMLKRQKKKVK